jgi:HSP20 family protein
MKDAPLRAPVPASLTAAEDESASADLRRGLEWGLRQRGRAWRPPTDVYETETAYMVVVELSGMRGIELAVSFDHEVLSIRGSRPEPGGSKAFHQMEINYGEFLVDVHLHAPVDRNHIEATYSDGFLRVALPKAPPKTIAITS